jgi:hypothetical protein
MGIKLLQDQVQSANAISDFGFHPALYLRRLSDRAAVHQAHQRKSGAECLW